jgi:hypothetical protein
MLDRRFGPIAQDLQARTGRDMKQATGRQVENSVRTGRRKEEEIADGPLFTC